MVLGIRVPLYVELYYSDLPVQEQSNDGVLLTTVWSVDFRSDFDCYMAQ